MAKIGETAKSGSNKAASETVPAWFVEYQKAQETEIARLKAELETAKSQTRSSSGRTYAPTTTTPEQAKSLTMAELRDLGHSMVQYIPNSPKDEQHPFGQPVLRQMNNSQNKSVVLKSGLDYADYKKIKDLVTQVAGAHFWNYRELRPLSDEQVAKVLCPVLDNLGPQGAKLFSW